MLSRRGLVSQAGRGDRLPGVGKVLRRVPDHESRRAAFCGVVHLFGDVLRTERGSVVRHSLDPGSDEREVRRAWPAPDERKGLSHADANELGVITRDVETHDALRVVRWVDHWRERLALAREKPGGLSEFFSGASARRSRQWSTHRTTRRASW